MNEEPMTVPERRAKRTAIRGAVLAAAEREALSRNRSLKCRGYEGGPALARHANEDGGCKNDGSGCLCECHDPTT